MGARRLRPDILPLIAGLLALWVLAALAGGCTSKDPFYCDELADCKNGEICDPVSHTCVPAPGDARVDLLPDGPAKGDAGGPDLRDGAGPDVTDGAVPDVAKDAAGDIEPDKLPPDMPPPDKWVPDKNTKLPNGAICTIGSECQSGFCVGNVCCSTSCSADCETCNKVGSIGTCSYKAAGTTCGAKTTCSGSTLTDWECDGLGPTCKPGTIKCDPYMCASTGAKCLTSCTLHSECSSGLCDPLDLFGTKGQCIPESSICYADPAASCPGQGTRSQPYCWAQTCLDKVSGNVKYTVLANGTYNENLTVKGTMTVVATGTKGPLLDQYNYPTNGVCKATVVHQSGSWGLTVFGSWNVGLVGILFTASAGVPTALVHYSTNNTKLTLKTCYINDCKGGDGLQIYAGGPSQSVVLEDTAIAACKKGIDAVDTDLTLDSAAVGTTTNTAIIHSKVGTTTPTLKLYDVLLALNYGTGVQTYGSKLDIDRLMFGPPGSLNSGIGMALENNTTGNISNTLIRGMGKQGIYFFNNSTPVTFTNVTVANNAGLEAECPSEATFYNSILWDDIATSVYSNDCYFYYSDVKGIGAGNNNINANPAFDSTSTTDPYRITASSPCVDTGLDVVPGVTIPAKDIIGNNRKVDKVTTNTTIIDMGAYEVQ